MAFRTALFVCGKRFFTEFDRSRDFGPSLGIASEVPGTNLLEAQDHFEIRAELPGVTRKI